MDHINIGNPSLVKGPPLSVNLGYAGIVYRHKDFMNSQRHALKHMAALVIGWRKFSPTQLGRNLCPKLNFFTP
jgi:hypothetical protein